MLAIAAIVMVMSSISMNIAVQTIASVAPGRSGRATAGPDRAGWRVETGTDIGHSWQ